MLISESHLRSIIFKSLLLEGFVDDQRSLIEKYPQAQAALLQLQPVWISWLASRFGVNATITDIHPFNEVIESVASFAKVFDSVAAKWKSNEEFRKNVEEFLPNRAWKKLDITPQTIPLLTSDEMETLKGLATREKQHFKINVSEEEMESDRVGKVGSWNLWMPTTRERSCKIAGYDPVTLKPKTTWCTARMAGSNLFYSYIGSTEEEITLFYIIKDNPAGDDDWLSVGFVNGKPSMGQGDGAVSVDRKNAELTLKRLKSILGSHYNEIINQLKERNRKLGGRHPARQKIVDAAQSHEALRYLVTGVSKDDALDLKAGVLREPKIDLSVLSTLATDPDKRVRALVARDPNTPLDILSDLSTDVDSSVRVQVDSNPNTPPDIRRALSTDVDSRVRVQVASNPNTPPDILSDLSTDVDSSVRVRVASNPNTPPDILRALSTDVDSSVRVQVASKPNTPLDILRALSTDVDSRVRALVASKPNTPLDILRALSTDEAEVKIRLAVNPNTPIDILRTFSADLNKHLTSSLAQNPNTPPDILRALSTEYASAEYDVFDDSPKGTRVFLASNPNTPPDVLRALSTDTYDIRVKYEVAKNLNTPPVVLRALLAQGGRDQNVKYFARDTLERLSKAQNEGLIRRLIQQML